MLRYIDDFHESIRSQEWQDQDKKSIFRDIKNKVQDSQENFLDSVYHFLKNCGQNGYSVDTSFYFTSFLTGLINYQFDNGVTCNLDSQFEDFQFYLNIDKKYTTTVKDLKTRFGISLHLCGLTLVGNNNLQKFFSSSGNNDFTKVKHWCFLGLRTTHQGQLISTGEINNGRERLEFTKSVEYHIVNNPLIFYFHINKSINEKYDASLRLEITTGDVYYKYAPLKGYLHILGVRACTGINYNMNNGYIFNTSILLGIRELIPLIKNVFKDCNFALRSFIVYGLCLRLFKDQ